MTAVDIFDPIQDRRTPMIQPDQNIFEMGILLYYRTEMKKKYQHEYISFNPLFAHSQLSCNPGILKIYKNRISSNNKSSEDQTENN